MSFGIIFSHSKHSNDKINVTITCRLYYSANFLYRQKTIEEDTEDNRRKIYEPV